MNLFKTGVTVCMQNLRKWGSDYKVLIVLLLLLIVNHYHASWFLDFAGNVDGEPGVAPWIYVFAFTGFGFDKIMMLLPMLLLFSNAPFIDDNQPFVICRASRKSWCLGQVLYIIVGSFLYVVVSAGISVLMLFGHTQWTLDWGIIINTAAKASDTAGAGATGVTYDIVYYFSPLTAMFYTVLLAWFSCIVIGLLVYVINSMAPGTGYGVFAGGLLIVADYVQFLLRSSTSRLDWLSYLSPVTWCSINQIDISGKKLTPDITYVLWGYAVLIVLLCAAAFIVGRKQEIKAVQSV